MQRRDKIKWLQLLQRVVNIQHQCACAFVVYSCLISIGLKKEHGIIVSCRIQCISAVTICPLFNIFGLNQ